MLVYAFGGAFFISQHKKVDSQHLATCKTDVFCYNIFCMATGKEAVKYRGLIGKK